MACEIATAVRVVVPADDGDAGVSATDGQAGIELKRKLCGFQVTEVLISAASGRQFCNAMTFLTGDIRSSDMHIMLTASLTIIIVLV